MNTGGDEWATVDDQMMAATGNDVMTVHPEHTDAEAPGERTDTEALAAEVTRC